MPTKLYQYPNCSTCRKAIKFLDAHGIVYTSHDITQTPPSQTELRQMLKYINGDFRKLFNTSGQQYRELDIKSKLSVMTESDAIGLLSQNGKLIKRPFLITSDIGLIGFKEDLWRMALL